jgi:hypothetical protein
LNGERRIVTCPRRRNIIGSFNACFTATTWLPEHTMPSNEQPWRCCGKRCLSARDGVERCVTFELVLAKGTVTRRHARLERFLRLVPVCRSVYHYSNVTRMSSLGDNDGVFHQACGNVRDGACASEHR